MASTTILTGLLLAAVQKVRQTSDRLVCSSNLRQIALATEQYQTEQGRMPPGSTRNADSLKYVSWLARLLPYLDQQSLWDTVAPAYAANSDPLGSPEHPATGHVMILFACPSDARTQVAWRLPSQAQSASPVALTSYLGNYGISVKEPSGVLFVDSRTQSIHITDGTSQTLLAGERPPSPDLIYGWWYYGIGQGGGSLDYLLGAEEISRSRYLPYRSCNTPQPYHSGNLTNICDTFHYWSLHSNGANFAFCDGSVRFLNYSAADVLPSLSTRAGGESVAIP
jgi:prepilin-type processing-associated H-X9-DG protein